VSEGDADAGAPVSWFLIERGWKVLASDGSEVGTVDEVVGDSTHDIFDGLTIRSGLFEKPRYVPAEDVDRITVGRATLRLSAEQAKNLSPYDQPAPVEEIVPEGASWWTRLLDRLRGPRT